MEEIIIDRDKLHNLIMKSGLYSRQFGSFNKSDYEVLMFTAYLDSLDDSDEVLDYDISLKLGITESKVRSLREKSQLRYPREIHWEDKLTTAIKRGTYDSVQKMITITIEDPSVRNKIRNVIESKYGTVNLSLNSKQLVLPIESFLILAACAEENTDEVLKKLNKELKKSKIDTIEKGKTKGRFLKQVNDLTAFLVPVCSLFTAGQSIINAVLELI